MSFVCSLADKLLKRSINGVVNFFSYIDLFKTINVYGIENNYVYIDPSLQKKLYAIKLENNFPYINELNKLNNIYDIANESSFETKEKTLAIFFVKNDLKQSIYIHSLNKIFIEKLSSYFNVDMLSGKEIVDSLFDIFNLGDYVVKNNEIIKANQIKQIDFSLVDFQQDIMNYKFRKLTQIALDKIWNKYKIYQGVFFGLNNNFIPSELFKIDWNGTLSIWLNFDGEQTYYNIKNNYDVAKYGDTKMIEVFKKLLKEEDKEQIEDLIKSHYCLINSILYLKDNKNITRIQDSLKIQFEENLLTSNKIISKTILLNRDTDFNEVVPIEYTQKFFATMHKKSSQNPDFYAIDINNSFVNFSFSDNQNPHSFIGGDTGAGKSVAVLKLMTMFANIDLNNFKSDVIENKKVKFRYSDVGYTAGNIVKNLKYTYPDEVKIIRSQIGKQKFSLFDVEKNSFGEPLDNEVEFVVNLVNVALEAVEETQVLKALEQAFFKETFRKLITDKEYIDYSLEEIRNLGFEEEVEKMLNSGYALHSKISEVKTDERLEEKFKQPTLDLMIEALHYKSKLNTVTEENKLIMESLGTKLEILKSYKIFNDFSNVKIDANRSFYYVDFDEIKDDKKNFIVIFWLLFKRWITLDKKIAKEKINNDEEKPIIYYIVEEAHNFFAIKSFRKMLETVTKELRKFGGRLVFISQKFDDIPSSILSELSTKIYIFPEGKKLETKKMVKDKFKISEKGLELFDYVSDKPRIMFVYTDRGVSLCHLPIKEEELKYFQPFSDL